MINNRKISKRSTQLRKYFFKRLIHLDRRASTYTANQKDLENFNKNHGRVANIINVTNINILKSFRKIILIHKSEYDINEVSQQAIFVSLKIKGLQGKFLDKSLN
ncbi:hypothetical protein MXB_780 [Myxobolus squamalis]|nr:hypothetical protein MXB_780 [Myxobolus squamalis]